MTLRDSFHPSCMSYLFLDTSHLPTIGLLDSNFEWVEYKVFENNKSSQFIHHEINELLIRAGSDIKLSLIHI